MPFLIVPLHGHMDQSLVTYGWLAASARVVDHASSPHCASLTIKHERVSLAPASG